MRKIPEAKEKFRGVQKERIICISVQNCKCIEAVTPGVFCKKGILKNLAKDLAGLRPAILSKKRL